jgi:predicted O-methyltransferase YrrM
MMPGTDRFQSLSYRVSAFAVNGVNPATWPYLWERMKRRVTGTRPQVLAPDEIRAIYGSAMSDLPAALRALGLDPNVYDPRRDYFKDFAAAEHAIAELKIPFSRLGLAGSGDLTLLHSVALALKPHCMLETGVALGWSTLVLLKFAQRTGGQLISIDLPYPFLHGHDWVAAAVPEDLRKNWILLRTSDRGGLPKAFALCPAFDLIHYDSDKTAAGRRWAYPKLWEKLAPGGVMISDDVDDTPTWAEFCGNHALPLIVVQRGRKLAGIARKAGAA